MRADHGANAILLYQSSGALHRVFILALVIVLDQLDLLTKQAALFVLQLYSQLDGSLARQTNGSSRTGHGTIPADLDGISIRCVIVTASDQRQCHHKSQNNCQKSFHVVSSLILTLI